ncbi:MAG: bL17 family ribosomal protein [Thermoguttaceae bacterium]
MRHKRIGRKLGRNPNHQRALLKNLVISLLMTESEVDEHDVKAGLVKPPKYPGRIVTTMQKAKEVRPLVEKCITLGKKAQKHLEAAKVLEVKADRGSKSWREWRESEKWQEWNRVIAPALAYRRRALQLIGSKEAVAILFDKVAPRFMERNGGYTRILRLAKPRLGDAGTRVVFEFVGRFDRVKATSLIPTVES